MRRQLYQFRAPEETEALIRKAWNPDIDKSTNLINMVEVGAKVMIKKKSNTTETGEKND